MDWTTGLSYFPFLDKFLHYFWKQMTIVGHHSVFITKCKYTFDDTVYCKLPEVEKFCVIWSIDWQPKTFPA